jgi:hypothetical protein
LADFKQICQWILIKKSPSSSSPKKTKSKTSELPQFNSKPSNPFSKSISSIKNRNRTMQTRKVIKRRSWEKIQNQNSSFRLENLLPISLILQNQKIKHLKPATCISVNRKNRKKLCRQQKYESRELIRWKKKPRMQAR